MYAANTFCYRIRVMKCIFFCHLKCLGSLRGSCQLALLLVFVERVKGVEDASNPFLPSCARSSVAPAAQASTLDSLCNVVNTANIGDQRKRGCKRTIQVIYQT